MRLFALAVLFLSGCYLSHECIPGEYGHCLMKEFIRPSGLFTDPSPLVRVPEGAMEVASNVVIRRPGVLEPRPGIRAKTHTAATHHLAFFDSKLYAFSYHSGAAEWRLTKFTDSTTSAEVLDESSNSIQFTEGQIGSASASGSLFFTSNAGVKRHEAGTTTSTRAGAPQAPNPDVANATGSAITMGDSAFYRVVFGRYAGERLILGAPGGRTKFTASGANRSVSVTVVFPEDLVAGDRVLIYRSQSAATPSDEYRLITDFAVTSAMITAGAVAFEDHTTNANLSGAALYTNSTQQGIALANMRPQFCTDIAPFNGMMFYAGSRQPQRVVGEILRIGSPVDGLYWDQFTGDFTLGNATITNVAGIDWTGLRVGQWITDSAYTETAGTNVAANTTIASWNQGAATITVNAGANILATNAGVTIEMGDIVTIDGTKYYAANADAPGFNEFDVSQTWNRSSFAKVVYRENATYNVFFEQSALDNGSGGIVIEREAVTDSSFTVTTTSPRAFAFANMSSSGSVTSVSDGGVARLSWSKLLEPEHVPLPYFQDIGRADKAILRLLPTRDALFIFKEDGIWRLTGRSPETISIEPFDADTYLLSKVAATVLNDRIYAWTSQGPVRISDAGIEPIGAPIQNDLTPYEFDMRTGGASDLGYAFMASYRPESEVYMGLPDGSLMYVFNEATSAWTTWQPGAIDGYGDLAAATLRCGIEGDPIDLIATPWIDSGMVFGSASTDLWSMADGDDANSRSNYDNARSVTINAINGNTLTLSAAVFAFEGGVIVRGAASSYITAFVNGSASVTIADSTGFTTGAATLYDAFAVDVTMRPVYGGDPGVQKLWREVTLHHEQEAPNGYMEYTGQYANTTQVSFEAMDREAGGVQRIGVRVGAARGNYLKAIFQYLRADAPWKLIGLSYVFEPMSERM